MRKTIFHRTDVSRLGLGGGKMLDLSIKDGLKLIETATRLGINLVDAHHRYGNCETILNSIDRDTDILKMTKVSAYEDDFYNLFYRSQNLLSDIFIFWVSDLDNDTLYQRGNHIYNTLYHDTPRIGITTESSKLAIRFLKEHPECDYFMVPIHHGRDDMSKFSKFARKEGKKVFAIKVFDDGRSLAQHSIRDCLAYAQEANPHVVLVGTKSEQHLEETVKTWEELDG